MIGNPFAITFNEESKEFDKETNEYNLAFIKAVETTLNNILYVRREELGLGEVTLNEARDLLGYDSIKIGDYVGWSTDSEFDFVDLGLSLSKTLNLDPGAPIYLDIRNVAPLVCGLEKK